jgi:peptide/nickel transport system permease protein
VSLFVGFAVAVLAVVAGVAIGVVAGWFRRLDGLIMRVMDGLMAIPAILLAIALVAVSRGGIAAVIVAIVVPEVPRVVRLVRAIVLATREEPFVEAAVAAGTRAPALIVRHILPATWSSLIVQATYICATAILVEAILSFLGVGIPPETPTWGNIMAEGRTLFRIYPHSVLWPGLLVALTVLSINLVGDGLRDVLDPRFTRTP